MDEVSTQYGHLAEAFSYPADYSSVTFRMNPRAKWADGEPVTAEDAGAMIPMYGAPGCEIAAVATPSDAGIALSTCSSTSPTRSRQR